MFVSRPPEARLPTSRRLPSLDLIVGSPTPIFRPTAIRHVCAAASVSVVFWCCRHGRAGPVRNVLAVVRRRYGEHDDQERPGMAGSGELGGDPVPSPAPDRSGNPLVGTDSLLRRPPPHPPLLPLHRLPGLQTARHRSPDRWPDSRHRPGAGASR